MLILSGFIILLVGLGAAAMIWSAQDRLDQEMDGTDSADGIPIEQTRRYNRDAEMNYGKAGLLTDQFFRKWDEWTHGKPLARSLAVISVLGAGVCFAFARR